MSAIAESAPEGGVGQPISYVYDGRECVGFVLARGRKGHDKNFDMSNLEQSPTCHKAKLGGGRHRRKGDRIEREIVVQHIGIGIKAYPLSGASRFRGSGHDLDIYAYGPDEAPLVAEVKARKSGSGFVTLESWLAGYDILFLRRNNADPLVVLPWRTWARLLERVRR